MKESKRIVECPKSNGIGDGHFLYDTGREYAFIIRIDDRYANICLVGERLPSYVIVTKTHGIVSYHELCAAFGNHASNVYIIGDFDDVIELIRGKFQSECIICQGTLNQICDIRNELAHSHECKVGSGTVITIHTICKNDKCVNPRHMKYRVKFENQIIYQYGHIY